MKTRQEIINSFEENKKKIEEKFNKEVEKKRIKRKYQEEINKQRNIFLNFFQSLKINPKTYTDKFITNSNIDEFNKSNQFDYKYSIKKIYKDFKDEDYEKFLDNLAYIYFLKDDKKLDIKLLTIYQIGELNNLPLSFYFYLKEGDQDKFLIPYVNNFNQNFKKYINEKIDKELEIAEFNYYYEKNKQIIKQQLQEELKTKKYDPFQSIEIDEDKLIDKCTKNENITLSQHLESIDSILLVPIKQNNRYDAICITRKEIIEIISNSDNVFYHCKNKKPEDKLIPYIKLFDIINVELEQLINILMSDLKIFYFEQQETLTGIVPYKNILNKLWLIEVCQKEDNANIYSIKICGGEKCTKTNPKTKWFFGLF